MLYSVSVSTAVDCGPLPNLDNGQVDTSSGTAFGSVATFSCNTGYRLSHQQVVMCGADRMWSPASPSCLGRCKTIKCHVQPVCDCMYFFHDEVINCGPLTDPDDGQVNTSNGTTFGRIATYTCYRKSGSRTCETNGTWTLEEPNCQGSNLIQ